MRPRRALLLPAGLAVVALVSPAHAVTSLDGVRRTEHSYAGTLSQPVALAASAQPGNPERLLRPTPADCAATSCHLSEIVLQLPAGRQSGQLTYAVTAKPFGAAIPDGYADLIAFGVYDAKGVSHGYWSPTSYTPSPGTSRVPPDVRPTTASKPVVVARLSPGRYTLIVYNLGVQTSFSANLTWHVNKSHRLTP